MRIAMMTNNYKPFVGGVPISIERLADSLRDLGHSVYVFAPDYKSPVDDDEYTFRFPTMKHKIAGAIPIPNLIYGYVKNAISTLDIDLIHVHHPVMIGNVATRIGKEFHIPVVFTYHTRYEQYLHYLTPFGYLQNKANQGNLLGESILDFAQRQVIQRYLNRFLEKCDMVFAPTESIQNYLKPFHIDTPISIAPTGLPPACFENHIEATAIRKKYLQKKQYLFCTVSRLAKEKNLSFLLRGVSAVKKQLGDVFNVLILGDGPEKENLIALSQTLKIEENVFFIGEVSNHKISAYHQACDLFLFSSKSETQGIVLLEAMAAYLPVFAIRATGVSDVVVNGENGVLSSDSITEWADNLISILKNPAVLIKMRSSARTTALLYDEKSIANQILESYAYLKKSYEAEHWLMMHLNRTSYPYWQRSIKMDIILETKDLTKTYKAGGNHINAVDHTSICVERGDFVTIVGKSGSGKSTLLHLIGGLDYPTSGEVWIDNECITNMNEEDLSAFRRRKIGFIFQAFNLVPSLNVWENIILPIGLDDRKPDMVYLKEIIELLGLSEKLNNLPNTLSGGQQQRVAIARALATKPAIVLADEPTGNLDSKTSDEVMALLKTSAMKYEQTLIVITHNEDIAQMGNRKLVITDGKVVEQ